MALLHQADLRPTKLELLATWLPNRGWYDGLANPEIGRVASYRFDDPEGEVGIETILVGASGGRVLQIPLTYRAAPLAGAGAHLVGTTDHSVLGKRWVYDGCADPAYVAALACAILTGGCQADEVIEIDGVLQHRAPSAVVRGTGGGTAPVVEDVERYGDKDPATVVAGGFELAISRLVPAELPESGYALVGHWSGQDGDIVLATARLLST